MRRLVFVVGLGACSVLAVAGAPREAQADETPSAERLKSAAEEYDRGRRAFLADDFEGAGVHFENAYRDAPRAETLRLAIRARRKAKQLARAATLAAVAAERYPNDAPTAQLAKETLEEGGPQLHEVLFECTADCAITVDGRLVSQSDGTRHRLFVEPGNHEVGVSFKLGGSIARRIDARKGGKETSSFAPPPVAKPPPVTPPGPGTAPAPGPAAGETSSRPFPPVVFFVAAGVTVALGAATVVSGIDAKKSPGADAVRLACVGKGTSCSEYQDGRSAQTRTNVLLGVTAGVALITAVVGIAFTQWSSSPVKVGAAPLPGGGSIGALVPF